MPDAVWIRDNLQAVVEESGSASIFIRIVILALVGFFLARRKIASPFLAALVGALSVTVALMSVVFEEQGNPVVFAMFFALGLVWGREALVIPREVRPAPARLILACAFGLAAFFYPHFVEGVWGAVLFAPVGVIPCPTLILACAALLATGRSFSLLAAAPTWVLGALFGALGVFYLGVKADWILIAAVAASIAAYFTARVPVKSRRRRGRPAR